MTRLCGINRATSSCGNQLPPQRDSHRVLHCGPRWTDRSALHPPLARRGPADRIGHRLGCSDSRRRLRLRGRFWPHPGIQFSHRSEILARSDWRLFLCYLGVRTFFSIPGKPTAEPCRNGNGYGWLPAYFSTLLLTLTNPMTILSFVFVFAAFGVGTSPNYWAATALVAGVFVGSALWWLLLSTGVGLFRSRIDLTWMRAINRLSGLVILAFGLYSLSMQLFR
jgi:hypothetical protein